MPGPEFRLILRNALALDGLGGEKIQANFRIQHLWKPVKKIKTQADIRNAFFDPAHGSRVRLSSASLTNSFQAPILRQEVDHDPMPMDACDGSSEQSRCDIVTTNSNALSPRDLLPLQLQANLPLQQVELDQMQTDERSQHNCIGPLKLDHPAISPGSSALRSWNTLNPRKGISRARPSNGDPSTRHCAGISRLALKPRRSVLRLLQRVSSLQAGSFRAGNSGYEEPSVAPTAAVDHINPRTSSLWLRRPLRVAFPTIFFQFKSVY